jgi:hypothetical protein
MFLTFIFSQRAEAIGGIPQDAVEYPARVILSVTVALIREGKHLPRKVKEAK